VINGLKPDAQRSFSYGLAPAQSGRGEGTYLAGQLTIQLDDVIPGSFGIVAFLVRAQSPSERPRVKRITVHVSEQLASGVDVLLQSRGYSPAVEPDLGRDSIRLAQQFYALRNIDSVLQRHFKPKATTP
jgi:hypothetical protein